MSYTVSANNEKTRSLYDPWMKDVPRSGNSQYEVRIVAREVGESPGMEWFEAVSFDR